ncbi:MFS transporter [Niveibacterium sp. SC-1]|uniref:MFS transporter n=1 Tax=Niveibacterium sp. SC-1 TaxID=3135646 RepID=UPI00311E9CE5
MTSPQCAEPQASMWRVVPALGVTQIVGWGSLYYSIAVLAKPMAESLQTSPSVAFGAFSASLVVSGLAAPLMGRAIDRHGGRRVLSLGSVCAALALALVASAQHLAVFIVGWLLAGVAMAACLYDAAFPALGQLAGLRYRSALTALTLFGGFASTVFWPLVQYLQTTWDWRVAMWVLAALQVLVGLPLHLWGLAGPRWRPPDARPVEESVAPSANPPGFLWLAAALSANAFVFSAVGAHVVGALNVASGSVREAVWTAALIGPMQVAGRIVEFTFGRHWSAVRVGAVALVVTLASMLLLYLAGAATWTPLIFAVCYGAANGVMTIVRGTVPAELFGRERYGHLLGKLARPSFFAKAAAPLAVSLLLTSAGYDAMAVLLAGISFFAAWGYRRALRANVESR